MYFVHITICKLLVMELNLNVFKICLTITKLFFFLSLFDAELPYNHLILLYIVMLQPITGIHAQLLFSIVTFYFLYHLLITPTENLGKCLLETPPQNISSGCSLNLHINGCQSGLWEHVHWSNGMCKIHTHIITDIVWYTFINYKYHDRRIMVCSIQCQITIVFVYHRWSYLTPTFK